MTNNENLNTDLDTLFANERANTPLVSDDLLNRIMQDANAQSNDLTQKQPVPKSANWFANFLNSLGGWQSVGALTACACFGLYLGYSTSATNYLGVEALAQTEDNISFGNSFSDDTFYDVSTLEG